MRKLRERKKAGWAIPVAVLALLGMAFAVVPGEGGKTAVQVLGEKLTAAKQSVPTPTITSGPSGPTSSSSATFTYTDSQSGVTFECSLDTAAFATCPSSGITYTGLAEGSSHAFRVRAEAGGVTSGTASRSWSVDTTKPPAPTFTQSPDDPTSDTSPKFSIRDPEAGVSYLCTLDGGAQGSCGQEVSYKNVAVGDHCFYAVAVDAAGNQSLATSYCWTILLNKIFGITGTVTQSLYPGATRPVDLSFANPYNFDIKILDVTITVQAQTTKIGLPNPNCPGTQNLLVDRPFTGPVVVPANSTRSLSSLSVPAAQWPLVRMPNLPVNQDGCKSTTFHMTYTGTATKP